MSDLFKRKVEIFNYEGNEIHIQSTTFGKVSELINEADEVKAAIKSDMPEGEQFEKILKQAINLAKTFIIEPNMAEASDEDAFQLITNTGGIGSELYKKLAGKVEEIAGGKDDDPTLTD